MSIVCGIDFGTSNSSASYFSRDAESVLVELEGHQTTIPTALFFPEKNENPIFGKAAINSFIARDSGRFMRSMKRILGSPIMNSGTLVNGQYMKFDQIIELFLRYIKKRIESQAGDSIHSVVMGRPVHFREDSHENLKAAQQLKRIVQSAGFQDVEFQFEPIAAAFAHERHIEGEKLACVADVGGGTSDFTIIRVGKKLQDKNDRTSDIIANAGVRVGGNDFDRELSLYGFMPELGRGSEYGKKSLFVPNMIYSELSEWSNINFAYNQKNIREVEEVLIEAHERIKYKRLVDILKNERAHELLQIVEQSKIELTNLEVVYKSLSCVTDMPEVVLSRDKFNKYIEKEVAKILRCLNECLGQAQISSDKIELLILTGGSTEIPVVKNVLKTLFPNAYLSEGNKLSSVGLGLGYDSYKRFYGGNDLK